VTSTNNQTGAVRAVAHGLAFAHRGIFWERGKQRFGEGNSPGKSGFYGVSSGGEPGGS